MAHDAPQATGPSKLVIRNIGLMLSGALAKVAGVVLGGFTSCPVSEGSFGTLTLDEVFDDYFGPLGVPDSISVESMRSMR
jgi:muramoyltetrapeptide carboxypeptidase LdcA involved in peptidoglycan recycling